MGILTIWVDRDGNSLTDNIIPDNKFKSVRSHEMLGDLKSAAEGLYFTHILKKKYMEEKDLVLPRQSKDVFNIPEGNIKADTACIH